MAEISNISDSLRNKIDTKRPDIKPGAFVLWPFEVFEVTNDIVRTEGLGDTNSLSFAFNAMVKVYTLKEI